MDQSDLKKINLFIPGAAKSGTSSLHELLNLHPEINMSKNKEPHFISSEPEIINSTIAIHKYLENFDFTKKYSYRGESSTGYFYFEKFKENFFELANPNSKFILILRNPIDRTYSHYNYLKSLGSETEDLETAVLKDHQKEPSSEDLLPELIIKNYYQYSLYGKWLKRFLEHFDAKNVKIILFEDLKNNQLETINSCFEFLGIQPLENLKEVTSNKTVKVRFPQLYRRMRVFMFNKSKTSEIVKHLFPVKFRRKYKKKATEILLSVLKTKKPLPQITDKERAFLRNLYKDDVLLLQQITDLKFTSWQDFYKAS